MSADALPAGRVVVDDVWSVFDRRAEVLREESRKPLDRRRRRALFYDGLLLAPFTLGAAALGDEAWSLVALALALSYFFVCEALTGQTWGKRKMGLRVVRLDGRPLTIASCAARNVMLPVDAIGCYLLGYIVMVLSRRRQRLGDLVAGTVVTWDDMYPHVPADERGRTALLFGYPVVWVASAAFAVALIGSPGGSSAAYAGQASALCANARAAVGQGGGVETLQRAGEVTAQLELQLATLTPPASMRAAHARLLAAEERMSAELLAAASELRGSRNPRATAARLESEFEARRAADAQALAGLGLDACL